MKKIFYGKIFLEQYFMKKYFMLKYFHVINTLFDRMPDIISLLQRIDIEYFPLKMWTQWSTGS